MREIFPAALLVASHLLAIGEFFLRTRGLVGARRWRRIEGIHQERGERLQDLKPIYLGTAIGEIELEEERAEEENPDDRTADFPVKLRRCRLGGSMRGGLL